MSDESKDLTIIQGQLADTQAKIQSLFKKKTSKQFIKVRKGAGGKMFPYVPIDYTITELDKAFGIFWEFVTDHVEKTKYQIVVRGRLVIKAPNGFSISRPGVGRANIKYYSKDGKPTDRPVDEGNDEKAATSDAIKKAASLFGIAADVYYKEIEKYNDLDDGINEEEERKSKAMSRFFAVASERGFTAEKAKERIKEMYRVDHMEDLSAANIEATIKNLERYYEPVEPGEEPRKIGSLRTTRSPLDEESSKTGLNNQTEDQNNAVGQIETEEMTPTTTPSQKYWCKGKKHQGKPQEEQVETTVDDPWCSEECRESYYPSAKPEQYPWEKKDTKTSETS